MFGDPPTTSRRNLRIVENEAWQTPFMKATGSWAPSASTRAALLMNPENTKTKRIRASTLPGRSV